MTRKFNDYDLIDDYDLIERARARYFAKYGKEPGFQQPAAGGEIRGRHVVLYNVNGDLARYRISGKSQRLFEV